MGKTDRYTLRRMSEKVFPSPHSAAHILTFCKNCNQYVYEPKHPIIYNPHTTPRTRCENHGIYCVSCRHCSPAGTEKCKYCNNTSVKIKSDK